MPRGYRPNGRTRFYCFVSLQLLHVNLMRVPEGSFLESYTASTIREIGSEYFLMLHVSRIYKGEDTVGESLNLLLSLYSHQSPSQSFHICQ